MIGARPRPDVREVSVAPGAADDRFQLLVAAHAAIFGELELDAVLDRIVIAACELVGARYGALGVSRQRTEGGNGAGALERFIQRGMDDDTVRRIGRWPQGAGLLGAVIDDPRPIRLRELGDDPRSSGFPPNHPPMHSFLGVPIRVRDTVFGNLYLAEAAAGEFTAQDELLVTSLAGTAAIAIENARLFEQSRLRQRWLEASTEITQRLLSAGGAEPLRLIAQRIREIADADIVAVVLPTGQADELMMEVAVGQNADRLRGLSYPASGSLAGLAIRTGQPVLIGDALQQTNYLVRLKQAVRVGPVMVLPLAANGHSRGALLVGRAAGRRRFVEADLEMSAMFANHAALALEMSDSRTAQQRMALLEDRDRIARDLHDHVIQRIFAAGLSIESIASRLSDPAQTTKLTQITADLDDTIRQLRASIFQLRGPLGGGQPSLRDELLSIVDETTDGLGFTPRMVFEGPVDAAVPRAIFDDIAAVVREGLANVARHARATAADVELSVTANRIRLTVRDDGRGVGDRPPGNGLVNLRRRAENRGGSLAVSDSRSKGTQLSWTIPLT